MDRFRQNRRLSLQRKQNKQPPKSSPDQKKDRQCQALTQSPNRFIENALQKQVSSTRKFEEVQEKLREKEIAYGHLCDLYEKVSQQKEGIQANLNKQIEMYKQLSKETEKRAQIRLGQIQKSFKQQSQRKILQAQQKNSQKSLQKQVLQSQLSQLQKIANQLELKLKLAQTNIIQLHSQLDKVYMEKNTLKDQLEEREKNMKTQAQRYQGLICRLEQEAVGVQREWRTKVEEMIKDRDQIMKEYSCKWKQQLEKQATHHESQIVKRTQQLQIALQSVEAHKSRLCCQLQQHQAHFQQQILILNNEKDEYKKSILKYEQQIAVLNSEKVRLFQEIGRLSAENMEVKREKKLLEGNLEEPNFVKFRNRNVGVGNNRDWSNWFMEGKGQETQRQKFKYKSRQKQKQRQKQLYILKQQISAIASENNSLKKQAASTYILSEQVRRLRDIVLANQYEKERCNSLSFRVGKSGDDILDYGELCDTMLRRNQSKQGKGWRENYYITRTRR